MEVLTSNYKISNIKLLENSSLKTLAQSSLLWVWHADKIPPHIGISSHGAYFSLKANGKDEAISIDAIESIINRKEITTLCFELNLDISLENLKDAFAKYTRTIPNEITCLEPIKDLLDKQEVGKLINLLEQLYATDSVANVYGYNIDNQFDGIANYSIDDIHSRLQKLSNE